MFTPTDRTQLRDALIAAAHADPAVVGAALVGSAATGREDAWSDIDLVLQIARDADPDEVAARWTDRLYREGAADHLDVIAGGVLYRVFLLTSSLQVDLSFWPEDEFRGTEPGFELLFGTPQPATTPRVPDVRHLVGMAWLYALHARSAIARSRTWQAVIMLDHLRDQLLALACVRYDLNPHHGREADLLPAAFLTRLTSARAASTAPTELARSQRALLDLLAAEIREHDPALATRLAAPLHELATLANVP
ncbi:MAG TPA: nucleotidyltransferase domain-containing protein [Candidatus Ruania gallistercoris]|uniref:Nucleotidyltransferase domain-containing protein n=1 Tax=Candidatus Ruania gallistercoris TaxID=2838746 RepID=A0A9D2EC13_9MICO|nr:nucleotidyltransferase domain-containing protein [Candidatus Ruania gallistercoris]